MRPVMCMSTLFRKRCMLDCFIIFNLLYITLKNYAVLHGGFRSTPLKQRNAR